MAYPNSGTYESCCEGVGKSSAPEVRDGRPTCQYCQRKVSWKDISRTYSFSKTSDPIYICTYCFTYGKGLEQCSDSQGMSSTR